MLKRLVLISVLLPLLAMGGGQTVITGHHRQVTAASHSFNLVSGHYYFCQTTSCTLGFTVGGSEALLLFCNISVNDTPVTTPAAQTIANGAFLIGTFYGWAGVIPSVSAGGLSSIAVTYNNNQNGCIIQGVTGLPASTITTDPSTQTFASAGTTSTPSSGSITTVNSTDVIIGCFGSYNGSGTFTAGTGYTALNAGNSNMFCEYRTGTSGTSPAGTYNPSATAGSSTYWGAATAGVILQ
jgi:hypothetical protein